jgi:hypothetical protein
VVDVRRTLLPRDLPLESPLSGSSLLLIPSGRFTATNIPVADISVKLGNPSLKGQPMQTMGKGIAVINDRSTWIIGQGIFKNWQVQISLSDGMEVDFEIVKDRNGAIELTQKLLQPDQSEILVLTKNG